MPDRIGNWSRRAWGAWGMVSWKFKGLLSRAEAFMYGWDAGYEAGYEDAVADAE